MCDVLISLLSGVTSTLRTRASLQVEILARRHQLAVLQPKKKWRTSLRAWGRILWIALARLWPDWRNALVLVKPETVISWHRKGFRFCWKWKSRRGRIGRPGVSKQIRDLIRDMSSARALWGARRLHAELLKLGIEVSQATVAKHRSRLKTEYADIRQRVYRGDVDSPKSPYSVRWAALCDGLRSEIALWRSMSINPTPDSRVFPSERLTTPLSKDNCWRRHFLPKLKSVALE